MSSVPPPKGLIQNPSNSSTSSDEPIIIEQPLFQPGPSSASASLTRRRSRPLPRKASSINNGNGNGNGKARERGKRKSINLVELEDDEDDDDIPIFVGSTFDKYKYTSKNISTISSRSPSLTPGPGPGPGPASSAKSRMIFDVDAVDTKTSSVSKPIPSPNANSRSKSRSKIRTSSISSPITSMSNPPNNKGKGKGNDYSSTTTTTTTMTTTTPALPLLPDLALEPLPVPAWLGKTAILLQLNCCAVCKVRFKKTDSGAARWRHMSTCRPPLYRPPNPPPDLQRLIHESLHSQHSASKEPTSLLDLHVRQASLTIEPDEITSQSPSSSVKGGKKKKVSQKQQQQQQQTPKLIGLKSVTSVKATSERDDENWQIEINNRLKEFIGPPSSPPSELPYSPCHSHSHSPSPSPSRSPSPTIRLSSTGDNSATIDDHDEDHLLPSTQPLGESSLAQLYAKPNTNPTTCTSPSRSPSKSKSPITPSPPSSQNKVSIHSLSDQEEEVAEEAEIQLPPSSQKRSLSQRIDSDEEDDDDTVEETKRRLPFRTRGDSHVEGSLSDRINHRSTIPLGWGESIIFQNEVERNGGWTRGFV
ncbi:uncharacterized protein IL334_001956 [Kwoniella shivajii]|uniref:BED-type domain-containing protein n=1 Tax=Kwoniella shivajii TaxID=564305 RepID=A0ABZ1CUZ0_9TREE|nr:hypothetical protein IL334_001956 [Kwoniella shivajii]